jgi:GNAT superfamily N-acetyltransferase
VAYELVEARTFDPPPSFRRPPEVAMSRRFVPESRQRLAMIRQRYGFLAATKWSALRIAEKLFRLEIAEMLWLEAIQLPQSIEIEAGFTFRPLTPREIRDFAEDSIYEFSADCAKRAAQENQFCFALFAGERLANYSWYALDEVDGEHNLGAAMTLPSDMAYMYKAFTHPDYRGGRLFARGIALALQILGDRGITRLLTTIHMNNFASLSSCRRMGFKRVGRLWTIGRGNSRWAIKPRAAAERLGARVASATPEDAERYESTTARQESDTSVTCG